MNRTWLEIALPAGLALIVCTIGVFLLTMGGLLDSPEPEFSETEQVAEAASLPARPEPAAPAPALLPGEVGAIAAGDALFKGNCAQCHAITDVVVGPALAGITKRRSEKWLVSWVKNSSKVVASGDDYAVKLYNQYQKQQMPSFQLSAAEVRQILAYIESEEGKIPTRGAIAVAD